MITQLAPLPVVMPLVVAALLLALGHFLPRRTPEVLSVAVTVAVAAIDAVLAAHTAQTPITYLFGGWAPHDGLAIGVAFHIEPADAALAGLIAVLFAASFVFAWGFLEKANINFHVLMLIFQAAMAGFCLTHDLFNLFVWFEVMSVSAFALTAAELEAPALDGALNFTVTNALAGFMMLGGIGLIYSLTGQLDFTAIAQGIAADGGKSAPVVDAAFCLIASALLIKAAMVPFHFWLTDAHTVAPTPVSVIFSGAMVTLGVFGIARLAWTVFAPAPAAREAVLTILLWLGAASTVVGGLASLTQRHLKRMLAFSTISHTGVVLIGLALLSQRGLTGMMLYLAGHGLTKGALFMLAGILLATRGSADEIRLRGKGREGIWPAGLAMALGALLLGGLPFGLMDEGATAIDSAATAAHRDWVTLVLLIGGATTGAAVLRASGRIFLGLGPKPGAEKDSPTVREQEAGDRPFWLMLAPALLLLALALFPNALSEHRADEMAARFIRSGLQGIPGLDAAVWLGGHKPPDPHPWLPWVTLALAAMIAAYNFWRHRLPRFINRGVEVSSFPLFIALDRMHTGLIGDYVAWIALGIALLAGGVAVF